jgi:hypothetical protein
MTMAALVAWPDDRIAGAVADHLSKQSRAWRWLVPSTLASTRATLDDGRLRLDGEAVGAVLWRVAPEADLSIDFEPDDRVFADTEARSFWLAALNLPSVLSVIRPAAELFFARSGWMYWRNVLQRRRLRLAGLRFGGVIATEPPGSKSWMPYGATALRSTPAPGSAAMLGAATTKAGGFERIAFAGDELCGDDDLDGAARAQVKAAVSVLNDEGLHLGELLVANDGAVLAVDALPRIDDAATVRRLLPSILEVLDDAADRG